MKRKISIVAVLLLGMALFSCAGPQAIPDTARVVQFTVPHCE
jgi:hypothetical protein